MKFRKIGKTILLVVLWSVVAISIFNIAKIQLEERKQKDFNEQLTKKSVIVMSEALEEEAIEEAQTPAKEKMPISVDFEKLQDENRDIIAWVYCEDTPINYPIVQSEDNNKYLRRLIDGSRNTAGTLFADCRNAGDFSDFNTVIYGHNMKNKTMFGTLSEYRKQDYYEKHPVWYLATAEKNYKVELVSGYVTPSDSEIYHVEGNRWPQLQEAIKKSKFASNAVVSDADRFVTFSTCSREYEDARFVLLGVLREI